MPTLKQIQTQIQSSDSYATYVDAPKKTWRLERPLWDAIAQIELEAKFRSLQYSHSPSRAQQFTCHVEWNLDGTLTCMCYDSKEMSEYAARHIDDDQLFRPDNTPEERAHLLEPEPTPKHVFKVPLKRSFCDSDIVVDTSLDNLDINRAIDEAVYKILGIEEPKRPYLERWAGSLGFTEEDDEYESVLDILDAI